MRKKKHADKLKPYLLGTLFGYFAMLITILPASLVLSLMKSAAAGAGAAAVVALTIGGFVCGKTAGLIRRRDGLKTGLLRAYCSYSVYYLNQNKRISSSEDSVMYVVRRCRRGVGRQFV